MKSPSIVISGPSHITIRSNHVSPETCMLISRRPNKVWVVIRLVVIRWFKTRVFLSRDLGYNQLEVNPTNHCIS